MHATEIAIDWADSILNSVATQKDKGIELDYTTRQKASIAAGIKDMEREIKQLREIIRGNV